MTRPPPTVPFLPPKTYMNALLSVLQDQAKERGGRGGEDQGRAGAQEEGQRADHAHGSQDLAERRDRAREDQAVQRKGGGPDLVLCHALPCLSCFLPGGEGCSHVLHALAVRLMTTRPRGRGAGESGEGPWPGPRNIVRLFARSSFMASRDLATTVVLPPHPPSRRTTGPRQRCRRDRVSPRPGTADSEGLDNVFSEVFLASGVCVCVCVLECGCISLALAKACHFAGGMTVT